MKIKDFIKKCPVFLLLAVSGIAFTLIGAAGRFSIYKEYDFNPAERPFLALVMEGMSKGTAPWEMAGNLGMEADEFPGRLFAALGSGSGGQSIGDMGGEDSREAFAESGEPGMGEDPGISGTEEENSLNVTEAEEGISASETGGTGGEEKGSEEGSLRTKESAVPEKGQETAEDERTYEFQTVTEEYFDDAAFIGDSRTVGLFEYGGLEERADFYAKISLTIYNVFSEQLARQEGTGKKITAEEALSQKQYGKVYLMLGINELGTGTTETFMEEYKAVVARIRELQPDAVIFVEGIMKVTGEKNAEDPVFNNRNIEEKNAAIAQLADNRNIFYIDVNEAVCDAEGNLNAEYTIDEVHLKAKYYGIWKQFLLEHGIER